MKLTTKGRFAVTALLDIAMHSNNNQKPITLSEISQRQGISLSYLEQLFVKLRKGGIVRSYRGPGGGYILQKRQEVLNIAEITQAVDEDMDARVCRGLQNCNHKQKCLTHDLWDNLTKHVFKYLSGITLADLIKEPGLENDALLASKEIDISRIANNYIER